MERKGQQRLVRCRTRSIRINLETNLQVVKNDQNTHTGKLKLAFLGMTASAQSYCEVMIRLSKLIFTSRKKIRR